MDVFKVGPSFIITGKVVKGMMKPGMKLNLGKKIVSVSSVVRGNVQLKTAEAGNSIGFTLTDVDPDDLPALQELSNSQVTLTEQPLKGGEGSGDVQEEAKAKG